MFNGFINRYFGKLRINIICHQDFVVIHFKITTVISKIQSVPEGVWIIRQDSEIARATTIS